MILISEINSSPKFKSLYCNFSFSDFAELFADRAPVVFKQQSYPLLNFEKLLFFYHKRQNGMTATRRKGIFLSMFESLY